MFKLGFKSRFCPLLAKYQWGGDLTSLMLLFLHCGTGVIVELSEGWWEGSVRCSAHNALSHRLAQSKCAEHGSKKPEKKRICVHALNKYALSTCLVWSVLYRAGNGVMHEVIQSLPLGEARHYINDTNS